MKGAWSTLRDRRGIVALEFALIGGMLVMVMLAVWDIGNAAQQTIRLHEALHAAGQYALSFPTDQTGIRRAVTNALPSGWTNVTVSGPAYSCTCWSSSGSSADPSGTAPACSCPDGLTVEEFLQIGASRPLAPLLIQTLSAASASYVVRFQ